jgi:iron complex transport system permease protein
VNSQQFTTILLVASIILILVGLGAGSEGWSFSWRQEAEIIQAIRAPRSLGAWLAGALLGLSGALAQGLFRNPLADPYLLGSAAGAGLGVVLVIFSASAIGASSILSEATWLGQLGLTGAAFVGALVGVSLTLLLAGGAGRPLVLLLGGVVIGAIGDLLMLLSPEALRGKQAFLLGTTGLLGWRNVWVLAIALIVALPIAVRFARVLDALVLGEASAGSLGLNLPVLRLALVSLMALCTGAAVAQAGLIAFVGLVAPHLVTVTHGPLLTLSALAGGALLLAADIAARSVIAPQELPVGVLTAVVGGFYLMVLLRRRAAASHV